MAEPSDFATTILTSKLPQEVANFIPHSLDLSRTLLEKHLAVWFTNYVKMLIRFNQDLNLLVANGKDFFTHSDAEFGSIDRVWNCLASSVTFQIAVNDSVIKTIRADILSQLGAVKDDVSFSELVVNSKELGEISNAMRRNDPNADYQWNVKAPAVLSNFENYKRHEKSMLLNSFMTYLNTVNTRNSSMLQKNEKAVNYILKEFNIDREMSAYVDYMVKTHAEPPANGFAQPSSSSSSAAAATSSRHSSYQRTTPGHRSSVISTTSDAGTNDSGKKKSKLRSKVGSLLGRKKKNQPKPPAAVDAIPEDRSYSSNAPSRTTSFSTGHSLHDHSQPRNRLQSHVDNHPSSAPAQSSVASHPSPTIGNNLSSAPPPHSTNSFGSPAVGAAAGAVGAAGAAGVGAAYADHQTPPSSQNLPNAGPLAGMRSSTLENTLPLQPSVPSKPEPPREAKPDFGAPAQQQYQDGPNLERYASSDDDSDTPTDAHGNRLSMLQTHNLDQGNNQDGLNRPRDSSGKYSFEYGDENNSFSAQGTPKVDNNSDAFPSFAPPEADQLGHPLPLQQQQFSSVSTSPETDRLPGPVQADALPPMGPNHRSSFAPPPAPAPAPYRVPSSSSLQRRASGAASPVHAAPASGQHPPPPPPSRKVNTHTQDASHGRRDLHSLTFRNLPHARELFVQQPRALEDQTHSGTRSSLVSQTTGNSLFKQPDYFKHFGSSQALVSEGLNASVAEIVNVSFQNDVVTKSQILGEVAFNYNSPQPMGLPIPVFIPTSFSRFLLNELFMHQNGEGSYLIDTNPITAKTLGGLKYTFNLRPEQVPVLVKQIWKFEPHQASLIIKVSLNPEYASQIQLDGLAISASLDHNVESTSASSKPEGTFNKDKNRITWRFNQPMVLNSQNPEEKLIARIMTNGQARESPAGVQLKFNVHNPSVLYVPIVDVNQSAVPSVRSLTSGNYSSHHI